MRSFAPVLVPIILLTLVLILLVIRRPAITASAGGRVLAFFALFLLPALVAGEGLVQHLEQSKTTTFCLSCHAMEPYGRSLELDDPGYLPANHFQNKRVDRETACFTCHTTYAMFGDMQAKLNGMKHLWVNYVGRIPDKIELYKPYNNRECLYCHGGSRYFDEDEMHVDIRTELDANELSCLDCHDMIHAVGEHESLDFWEPETQP